MDATDRYAIEAEIFEGLVAGIATSTDDLMARHPGLSSEGASFILRVAFSKWSAAEMWSAVNAITPGNVLLPEFFVAELVALATGRRQ